MAKAESARKNGQQTR